MQITQTTGQQLLETCKQDTEIVFVSHPHSCHEALKHIHRSAEKPPWEPPKGPSPQEGRFVLGSGWRRWYVPPHAGTPKVKIHKKKYWNAKQVCHLGAFLLQALDCASLGGLYCKSLSKTHIGFNQCQTGVGAQFDTSLIPV